MTQILVEGGELLMNTHAYRISITEYMVKIEYNDEMLTQMEYQDSFKLINDTISLIPKLKTLVNF